VHRKATGKKAGSVLKIEVSGSPGEEEITSLGWTGLGTGKGRTMRVDLHVRSSPVEKRVGYSILKGKTLGVGFFYVFTYEIGKGGETLTSI